MGTFVKLNILFLSFFSTAVFATDIQWVRLPTKQLPLAAVHLTFETGSAADPQGEEGITFLMAALLREGGVKELSLGKEKLPARGRHAIEEYFYPLAADVQVSVRRDQTTLKLICETSHCSEIIGVLSQIMLAPAFDPQEFERLKTELTEDLERRAPREDQEELGKQALENLMAMNAATPEWRGYGHSTFGRAKAVAHLKLDRIQEYYLNSFLSAKLVVGVAGNLNAESEGKLKNLIEQIAIIKSQHPKKSVPESRVETSVAKKAPAVKMQLVEGPFEAVGMHFGMPISVTRGHPDFPALYLASQGLGKHRVFVGRLMQVVREERGLNYGTYSYIEELPDGGTHLITPVHVARRKQAFTVWVRPTSLENACFAFRQVFGEVESFSKQGLTPQEFKDTQKHLVGAVPLLALGLDRNLGFEMDSVFYGLPAKNLSRLQSKIRKLKFQEVQAAVRRHFPQTNLDESMSAVVVTPDPSRFLKEISAPECSIHYPAGVEKSPEIKREDALIQKFKVPYGKADETQTIKSESIYE